MEKKGNKILNFFHVFLFGKKKYNIKRSYYLNFLTSLIYSPQSAIFLLVVTRCGGLAEAGRFAIFYTVTQTLTVLGNFSMRNYQVSDIKNQYSFKTYYSSRVITCLLMFVSCFVYGVVQKLSLQELLVLLLLSLYRVVDDIEDVYHGAVQKEGRLDVSSLAMFTRILLSMLSFVLAYILTRNLLFASLCLVLVSFCIYLILNHNILKHFESIRRGFSFENVIQLLVKVFPVFLSTIIYSYLINASKYAIDRNLSKEMQTVYNILFMPIFVVNILSGFIFKPMIVSMGTWWNEGKLRKFGKAILSQCMIIVVITACVVVFGYYWGYSLLSLIYDVDLSQYRILFMRLLMFGGFSALSSFFGAVLTIMRKQICMGIGYVFALIINFLLIDKLVIRYNLAGAGYGYGLVMGVIFLFFLICIVISFIVQTKKLKKQNRNLSI